MDQEEIFQSVEFFQLVANRSQAEIDRIQWAYHTAKMAHAKQLRDDGRRYFDHPRSVAIRAIKSGFGTTPVVMLCLLHDVYEDTFVPPGMLYRLFGKSIYEDVLMVSKTMPQIDRVTGRFLDRIKKPTERYYRDILLASRRRVRLVKCFDRIDNVLDCAALTPGRRRKYAIETREFIYPIVDVTDPRLASELRVATDALDPGPSVEPDRPRS